MGLLCAGLQMSCIKHVPFKKIELIDVSSIVERLHAQSAKRERLRGTFHARALGIKRFFGKTDVDIVVQKPSSVYLAVRSFFEQPLQVFTCDGVQCCLWDAHDPQDVQQSCVDAHNPSNFILPIKPESMVSALLGVVPDGNPDSVEIDEINGVYRLKWRDITIEIRRNDERILRYISENFTVSYGNTGDTWIIEGSHNGEVFGLELTAKEVERGGAPINSNIFQLPVH